MQKQIDQLVDSFSEDLTLQRRDFHKFAEPGWTEFRTSSLIANFLENLGWTVFIGDKVCCDEKRLGLPSEEKLAYEYNRAISQGAIEKHVKHMKYGFTGVIGELKTKKGGPTIALRFDIDSNDCVEATDENHLPFAKEFASVNEKAMHACGHDGHAAIGMYVAKVLSLIKDSLTGTIRLIFQPAEEGVRGAYSIVENGWLDDVDYFLTGHIGSGTNALNELLLGMKGYMATTKLDIEIKGKNAHAGGAPQEGHNALLAACSAVLNMQSFLQHSKGETRLNVGVLEAGTGRNVVPNIAKMKLEVRGRTSEVNEYMEESALRVLEGACKMYNTTFSYEKVGGSISAASDNALEEMVRVAIEDMEESGAIKNIVPGKYSSGSEDACYMMKRVQDKGGLATYMGFGTNQAAGNHNSYYDFDEQTLPFAVKVFARAVYHLANFDK